MLPKIQQAQFVTRTHCINCGSVRLVEMAHGAYRDQPLAALIAADPWGENPIPFLQEATWSLVKCEDCDQIFHREILDETWNERRFGQWMNGEAIDQFEKRRRNSFARSFNEGSGYVSNVLRIERLTRPIRKREEPVSVLDFGCGSGGFLDVCDHFGFVTAGVDRSPARRDKAGPKIVPSLGHLASDTTFHAITLFEVLEHLDQPADILKSLHRRLKPDGILVLETPNCNGLKGLSTARDCYLAHPLDHINAFTHETLKSIAERQGFKVITRGPVFVSADTQQAIKRLGKHVLRRDGRSTQLYFRKV